MKRFPILATVALAILFSAACNDDNPSPVVAPQPEVLVEQIAMPHAGPFGAKATPDGSKLFVPLFGTYGKEGPGSTVAVVDTATDTVIAEIAVGQRPEDVDFTPDGAYAYVSDSSSGTVSVIHVPTLAVVKTIPVGTADATYPYGISILGDKAYVFTNGGNYDGSDENIFVLDTNPASPTFNTKIGSVTLSGVFSRGGFRKSAKELVVPRGVANNDYASHPEIALFSSETNQFLKSIPIVEAPGGFHGIEDVAVTPNGEYAYAPFFNFETGDAEVFVVDLANRTLRDLVKLDTGDIATHGVEMRPDGLLVGVTSWNKGVVSWIYTPTNTVVLQHTVGKNPNEIAFTPDGRKAYVTNQSSQSVHVLRLPSSVDLTVDLVQNATASTEAAADLAWRVEKLKATTDPNERQVWLDNVSMRVRFWADAGKLQVGTAKDMNAAGAQRNNFKVQPGGVLAAIE